MHDFSHPFFTGDMMSDHMYETTIVLRIRASSYEEAQKQTNVVVENINSQAYTADDYGIHRHDAKIVHRNSEDAILDENEIFNF
jgi:hypothetical protein